MQRLTKSHGASGCGLFPERLPSDASQHRFHRPTKGNHMQTAGWVGDAWVHCDALAHRGPMAFLQMKPNTCIALNYTDKLVGHRSANRVHKMHPTGCGYAWRLCRLGDVGARRVRSTHQNENRRCPERIRGMTAAGAADFYRGGLTGLERECLVWTVKAGRDTFQIGVLHAQKKENRLASS